MECNIKMIKCDIDEIIDMFNWNKSEETQKKGLELSKSVKCLKVFFNHMEKMCGEIVL